MILYFTGTGNSKYIAEALGDKLQDDVESLNDILKNNLTKSFASDKPFVIVFPIYAWGFPEIVREIVINGAFLGSKLLYFVATMGSQSGKADKMAQKMTKEKGQEFMGLRGIVMPNNYVVGSDLDDEKTNETILEKAMVEVEEIAAAISQKRVIAKTDKTPLAGLLSGPVHKMFSKYMIASKDFVITDKCVSCGRCAEICPSNNISIKEGGKPEFGTECFNCLGCINSCPQEAIQVPGKTENRGRYICKSYKC